MKTKLIIVSGMSGAGKSTTSQYISKLFKDNRIENLWYHEEMDAHPIRWKDGGEFKVGDLKTEEGMRENIADLLKRWTAFINKIKESNTVHVMEGCIFQNIVRYFFPAGYKRELIIDFYIELFKILSEVNISLVFLYSIDPKRTLEKAFETRGENWKKIILDPGDEEYYKVHGYKGDESIFTMWTDCRDLSKEIFDHLTIDKIMLKIDPSKNLWEKHHRKLAEHFSLNYYGENRFEVENPEIYCGSLYTKEGDKTSAYISLIDQTLYMYFSWFNKIPLIPIDDNEFQLSAFPTTIKFTFNPSETLIQFLGNYGWDINGEEFFIRN